MLVVVVVVVTLVVAVKLVVAGTLVVGGRVADEVGRNHVLASSARTPEPSAPSETTEDAAEGRIAHEQQEPDQEEGSRQEQPLGHRVGGRFRISLLMPADRHRPRTERLAYPSALGSGQLKSRRQLDQFRYAEFLAELTQGNPWRLSTVSGLQQGPGYSSGCPIATHLGGGEQGTFDADASSQAQNDQVHERTDHDFESGAGARRPG